MEMKDNTNSDSMLHVPMASRVPLSHIVLATIGGLVLPPSLEHAWYSLLTIGGALAGINALPIVTLVVAAITTTLLLLSLDIYIWVVYGMQTFRTNKAIVVAFVRVALRAAISATLVGIVACAIYGIIMFQQADDRHFESLILSAICTVCSAITWAFFRWMDAEERRKIQMVWNPSSPLKSYFLGGIIVAAFGCAIPHVVNAIVAIGEGAPNGSAFSQMVAG